MKNLFFKTSNFLLLTLFLFLSPHLQATEKSPNGELSLPWNAFEKLLQLDQDNISLGWEEFQRLIQQTGIDQLPPYQVKEGNVVLSRNDFKKILNQMKPPEGKTPKHYLTKALYKGIVGKKSTKITASIRLQIPGETKEIRPLRFPLFPQALAFEEILLNGQPALIENENGKTFITVTQSGTHEIKATFASSSSLEKAPYRISFSIPRTPITQLDFILPIKNLEVNVSNASETKKTTTAQGTRIKASLPVNSYVQITWNPIEPEKKKGPAKIYAVSHHILSVEEDALRTNTLVNLNVLQNTVNSLQLKIPEGYTVLDVKGDSLGEWKIRGKQKNILWVPFQYAKQGRFYVRINAEKIFSSKEDSTAKTILAEYPGFQVLKATRENGFIGVELKTTAEVTIIDAKGLLRQDIQELPRPLLNLTQRPLLYGFKYSRPTIQLSLDIQRHEEVAVVSTVVDEANGVTLVLEDGKIVQHLTFTVRNTWKQFLELKLPEEAQVWSVFVEGQQVKPSRNAEKKLLIPLHRSKKINGNLSSFDVEIMYYKGTQDLPIVGIESLMFPVPDIVVSQMLWSVYLPINHDYLYFSGTADKEKGAQGFKPLISNLRGNKQILRGLGDAPQSEAGLYGQKSKEARKKRLSFAKESQQWRSRGNFSVGQSVDDDAYARQVERELNFFAQVKNQKAELAGGGREVGVLPIRVKVPNAGQVYRFTKKIIVDQTPVTLDIYHSKFWVIKSLKFLLLLVLLWLALRIVKNTSKIKKYFSQIVKKHETELGWLISPLGSTTAAFILLILSSFMSRFLTALSVLLFIGMFIRWVWFMIKKRATKK